MAQERRGALIECAERSGLRALLITAAGPSFCVGGDPGQVGREPTRLPDIASEMVEFVQDVVARIAELPVLVVCAVVGAVAGVGFGIRWASDIVIATDEMTLATAFADAGSAATAEARGGCRDCSGLRRAQELMLLNRHVGASEALAWGLVTRLVPRGTLDDEAARVAEQLAGGATVALAHMRVLLRDSHAAGLCEHPRREADAVVECAASSDMREALQAFNERREPRSQGC